MVWDWVLSVTHNIEKKMSRYKIYIGTRPANGLFNITDTATGTISFWFSLDRLKEIKKAIKDKDQKFLDFYCIGTYEGFIVRKDRFAKGWTLDFVKYVDGELKSETLAFHRSSKAKVLAHLDKIYPIDEREDKYTYACENWTAKKFG